jgi:hypothetical protein
MEIVNVFENIYEENYQGSRLNKYDTYWVIHVTHLSHCITKATYLYDSAQKGDNIPFDDISIRRMELGKAIHLYYQDVIDHRLSELKDDKYGWYPSYHVDDADMWDSEYIERNVTYWPHEDLMVSGTVDAIKLDSKGFFIEDTKSTAGFKYIKGARENHKVQVHGYMYMFEKTNHPLYEYSRDQAVKWLEEWNNEAKNEMEVWEETDENLMVFDLSDGKFWDLDYKPIHRSRIRYVDAYNIGNTKTAIVQFRRKYYDFFEEQIDKYYKYIKEGIRPEPNYDYLAKWECNPKYCPFSKDKCPYSKYKNDNK